MDSQEQVCIIFSIIKTFPVLFPALQYEELRVCGGKEGEQVAGGAGLGAKREARLEGVGSSRGGGGMCRPRDAILHYVLLRSK